MAQCRAIFVLGLQRSGTTLAANLLAAHPQIAAVTAARHHGVHESVYFSHFARIHGDWSDPRARERSIAAFLDSDYFRLTGLDRDWAGAQAERCETPADLFRAVMDAHAAAQGAVAWVEKSPHHTLLAQTIAAAMPDAVFLCVTRDSESLLRSRLWSYGRVPPRWPRRGLTILRACASNRFHARHMAALDRRIGGDRVFHVTYAALAGDADAALAPLLRGLGLAPLGGRRPEFARNSSFASDAARDNALSRADRALARVGSGMATLLPQPLLGAIQRALSASRPAEFPPWVWPLPDPGDGEKRTHRP